MLAHFLSKKIEKKKSGTVATIKPHTPKEYKAESFHKTKNVFTIIAMKQELKTEDLVSGTQPVP